MAAERWVKAEVIESVVRGKKRRGQIVVTFGDKNVQKRILRHGSTQRLCYVDIAIFIRRVIPWTHTSGEDLVGQVAVELEIVAYVIVQHARIRADDGRDAGVEFRPFASGIAIDAGEARVNAADGAALATPVLFREAVVFEGRIG